MCLPPFHMSSSALLLSFAPPLRIPTRHSPSSFHMKSSYFSCSYKRITAPLVLQTLHWVSIFSISNLTNISYRSIRMFSTTTPSKMYGTLRVALNLLKKVVTRYFKLMPGNYGCDRLTVLVPQNSFLSNQRSSEPRQIDQTAAATTKLYKTKDRSTTMHKTYKQHDHTMGLQKIMALLSSLKVSGLKGRWMSLVPEL